MNAVCINIELASHDVEFNRRMALKKCVLRTPRLNNEFHKTVECDVLDPTWKEEFTTKLNDFIKEKGLHIIDEKPFVTIEDGKYKTFVSYQVSW